ncbi:MAG TPA: tail fiber domain-containing protein, partial [Verrucomicrobiae bacterium]|nr:tail fiber domain-containing protein [Verrucomicrobiae bacterium]
MKTQNVSFALLCAGWCALSFHAQAGPHLLPFQGRLSDANGQALPDGARVVQFKIYDAPVGGRAVWNGEVQKLSVNGGLVSTLLGTKADLSGVDFNSPVYLELTVDANGDSSITLADPPLLPRQSILPAIFAVESANSRRLEGYGWSALFGTNNPAEGTFLSSKIGDNTLTTSKIADGAVTPQKLSTTGAAPGQALTFNGTNLAWSPIKAVTAITAENANNSSRLNGFDWSALYDNANPQSGTLVVPNFFSRAGASVAGDLSVSGRSFLNGPTLVQGQLLAPSIGLNMSLNDWGIFLRGVGDFNHFLRWGNAHGGTTGFDGPLLVGNAGGVLGTPSAWALRWHPSGSVSIRGSLIQASDRNLKQDFESIDPADVLSKVAALPITRWSYKD